MSGRWSEPEHAGRPVERRLRAALAARAENITGADLRPARPPGRQSRRTRPARLWPRRLALPLAGLATAAAVAVGHAVFTPGPEERRPLPAHSPGPVEPPPTRGPSVAPSPKPSPPPSSAPSPEPPSVDRSPSSPSTPRGPGALLPSPPATAEKQGHSRGPVPQRVTPPPRAPAP
ncbi:hypothetical protein ACFYM2_34570 [Streptomyces sp. NPDC006711]|uniref:hypothetical protein n=1 Tax=unclassified Streptomyces TaxID=2593676 RepID=UPI0036C72A76